MSIRTTKLLMVALLSLLGSVGVMGQDSLARRTYTQEHPLVYEGAQDFWPYSFLNDNGQPDGFNIDLMKLMLGRLNIPYEIKMKPRMMAFRDLKSGQSDLMIGLTAGFHDKYGYYSENPVTLFTQSILSPKSKPTQIHNFRDLANHKVYVNDSSLCHHLMVDYGWGNNAIPTRTIAETVKQMSTDEEGELVWNTLSLKWLLRKFQIDNLEITPVDMPHGEYKFISNDPQLIHKLDSVFTLLNSSDQLLPLHNKWFYPERKEKVTPRWVWYAGGTFLALGVILLIYTLSYRLQARRITKENNKRNRRLALILETSGVRVWTYDIPSHMFTWRNEYGQPAYIYTREEFATRYTPEDFQRLKNAMQKLANEKSDEEEVINLDIRAKDAREDGDTEMRDFVIALSVLERDKQGKPKVLIGTKKDVTEKRKQEREANLEALRYWAIFNTPMVGILQFDKNGRLSNLNQKACDIYECNRDEIVAEHPTMQTLFDVDVRLEDIDKFHATQIIDFDKISASQRRVPSIKRKGKLYVEYRFISVFDENQELLGFFAICSDVTYIAHSLQRQDESILHLKEVKAKEEEYIKTINDFIRNGKTRMASYSPATHMLTIYEGTEKVQMTLTQTRIMTLIDSRMSIKAMRLISNMDSHINAPISGDIRTTLRIRGGCILHVYIHLLPQIGKNGEVKEYLGILREISEQKAAEQQLARLEAKAQEIEDTKTVFIRNMMEEIRMPMNKVFDSAAQLSDTKDDEHDQPIASTIMENAEQLTHIINNILNLSRIEAHMVEIANKPVDFAVIFETYCNNGWAKHRNDQVRYIVENPYKQLVVEIDELHLGYLISQLTLNAAQHTHDGFIRTRYDYIGRRLMISIEDTGEGIPADKLAKLNSMTNSEDQTSSGLGLTICKELLKQMGGSLEINSEEGLGTTVWVMLPCHATAIKRKKTV